MKNQIKNAGLKVRTNIRAGGTLNHNETVAKANGLKVRTSIRAGSAINHNEKLVRA